MGRFANESFSSKIWDWAMKQIPRVALRYPSVEANELVAELAATLLTLRRRPAQHVRDWQGYLIKCLFNHASRFATRWRATHVAGSNIDDIASPDPPPRVALSAVYRRLNNDDRHLVKQLQDCEGNVTRLARLRRQHRNTLHRRLRIIRARCPVEIESAPVSTNPATGNLRVQLAAIIESPTSSARKTLRARVIQALLGGASYNEITMRFGTSSATIARWRQRFEMHGVAGLMAKNLGRTPSLAGARFRSQLTHLNMRSPKSIRQLGRQFGLSKSTIHYVLNTVRKGAVVRKRTL